MEKNWKSEILDVISKLKIICGPGCTRIFKDSHNLHNIDFPAYIFKRPDGRVRSIKYYENNKEHRLYGKPAILYFHKLGNLAAISYCLEGLSHRPQRPTLEQCLDPNNTDNASDVYFNKHGKIVCKYYMHKGSRIVSTLSSLVPYCIHYYDSGKPRSIHYHFEDIEEIPPDWTATSFLYYENGIIETLIYLVNNESVSMSSLATAISNRPILPSARRYYETGILYEVLYKNKYDFIHRPPEEGPAITRYHHNGNISEEVYMINSYYENQNGPYLVQYDIDGIKKLEEYKVRRNSTLIKKIIKYDNEGNVVNIESKPYI